MAASIALQRRTALVLAAACLACASAGREGETIEIAQESAIILWDAASKTQHFIRGASFDTAAKDFGFLVPTPSVPELKEVEQRAFDHLERIASPPRREVAKAEAAPKSGVPPPAAAVEVIAQVKVADYDAAILKANDAGALDAWLKSHGYASSPELMAWARTYVERGWILTAFKFSGGEGRRGRVEASAIRMTFRTDAPVFPYREPARAGAPPPEARMLKIFFVSDFRPEGKIGPNGAWPGRTTYHANLREWDHMDLLRMLNLPPPAPGTKLRLTRFTDGSSPRPGNDDLYFVAAADQTEILPSAYDGSRFTRDDLLIGAALATVAGQWLTWTLGSVVLAAFLLGRLVRRLRATS